MRIGFIGLGNMGGPMALNLMKAGHALVVHDVRQQSAAPHLEQGARWAASPRAAAENAELILTSLPGPTEVERVATGGDGVIHGAARGAIYADLSTGSPTVMRRIHDAFRERGVHVLDAPVSGGVGGARHGTLQVMVGGDEAIYRRTKPVLEAIGDKVGYMVAEPQGAEHYTAIQKTAKALEAAFGPGWTVRTQEAIGLDDDSEPEPDVAVVPGGLEDYRRAHPSRPVLTVEVAESSLDSDRERKGSIYARAGLPDYWILNLEGRLLEVYREPTADASALFGWRYARREIFNPAAQVNPLAAPGASVRVGDLLPGTHRP